MLKIYYVVGVVAVVAFAYGQLRGYSPFHDNQIKETLQRGASGRHK